MMRVSVITTCYNAEKCIGKTIESVLQQTYTDFEYIVMDGASSDDTVKVAEGYREDFAKRGISYHIYSERDTGIYDGMNHGIAYACGDYIILMNADDCFYDERVLERIFSDKNFWEKFFASDVIYGDAAELEYGKLYYFVKNIDNIKGRMPFSHQSAFAKRELLIKHPFNLKYKIAADYDFIMNCYDEGAVFTDCGFLVCTVSKDGVSSLDLYNTFIETEEMLNTHGVVRYEGAALKKKLFFLRIRQFGMDYLPAGIKNLIRIIQRKLRGQDKEV